MTERKISIGETKAIEKELEAFAGPAKPRGCEICRRGADDLKLVTIARGRYTAQQIADFLIETRGYPASFTREMLYRHWHRCPKQWVVNPRMDSAGFANQDQ